MRAFSVATDDCTARAGRLGPLAAELGSLSPRLLAALASAGTELLPAYGLLDAVSLATSVTELCAPLPGGLPATATEICLLAAALTAAAAAYAAVDATVTACAAAQGLGIELHRLEAQAFSTLSALAVVATWTAWNGTAPWPLAQLASPLVTAADRLLEGREHVTELSDQQAGAAAIDLSLVRSGAASIAGALGVVGSLEAARRASTFAVLQTSGGPHPRFVVCLPGLHDLAGATDGAADVTGAVITLTGHSAYVRGVLDVLRTLPRGSRVLLVGHSQGGMVAHAVASDASLAGEAGVDIAGVLTAGSPAMADVPLSRQIRELALIDDRDPVPMLPLALDLVAPGPDLSPPPPHPGRAVVRFAGRHAPGALANHSLDTGGYLDVAASDDPRVRDFAAAMREFFAPRAVTARIFQVTDGGAP